jgi:hypothetical protein
MFKDLFNTDELGNQDLDIIVDGNPEIIRDAHCHYLDKKR